MRLPLTLLVGFFAGCHQGAAPALDFTVRAGWIDRLGFVDLGTEAKAGTLPVMVWRHDRIGLALDGAESVSHLKNQFKYLVMVNLTDATRLAKELKDDPATLAFLPPTAGRSGAALVGLNDRATWAALAAAAHRDSGHACGALELLNLAPLTTTTAVHPTVYPESLSLPAVATLAAAPAATEIEKTIKTLEALGTRRHMTASGQQVPAEVVRLFQAAAGDRIPGLAVTTYQHQATKQESVIVTIPGQKDDATTVVLGAHLDSINSAEGEKGQAPGADDDASGVATLVEIVRGLAAQGATFDRRVELHAYAAEEDGLVGSREIAGAYSTKGRAIAAMMQFDMNSWAATAGDDTIYLVSTDTSRNLRRAAKDLLHTYLEGGFVEERLDRGTSDHKAWTERGYPTVFPFENPLNYNRALHTVSDSSSTVNALPLAVRMSRLGLAFVAHQAGLVAAADGAAQAMADQKATLSHDLKLAIAPSKTEGQYVVHVAAPLATESVELCVIDAAGALSCAEERLTSVMERETDSRRIVTGLTALTLAAGSRLAVFGYDAADRLIAHRAVRLAAK